MEQVKSHRGAPSGNRNAVKHGYYCKELNKQDRSQLKKASNIQDIAQEIALLRFEIQKATSTGELAKLVPLSKAAFALEKLIRTQQKLFGSQNDLTSAFERAIRNVVIPVMSSEGAVTFLKWRYRDSEVPPEILKDIQKRARVKDIVLPGQTGAEAIETSKQNETIQEK